MLGDLIEGLNRRGARSLVIRVILGDLVEGLNRRDARSLVTSVVREQTYIYTR